MRNLPYGGVPERSNGVVSKTIVGIAYRGFESLPLRILPRLTYLAAGFVLLCLLCTDSSGQSTTRIYETVYRPLGVEYHVAQTAHFTLIYEDGSESLVHEAAAILDSELPKATERFPGRRGLRMPVVLEGFSDRPYGFVSPVPFRQEIGTAAIKGNRLSARHDSWLWTVAAHETVHAAQAQYGSMWGVGGMFRLVSPDIARALQLWFPAGVSEGVAVYHESQLQSGAGRLNHPFFQMHFWASMSSEDPWSLAQMLEVPAYAVPAHRYYIGGANFHRYLAEKRGGAFMRALRFHDRIPFAGHGIELRYATGRWPHQLGREFRAAMAAEERARQEALGDLTKSDVLATGPGHMYRRPIWLNSTVLLAHAAGNDLPEGFYTLSTNGARDLLSLQDLSEEFYASLSMDISTVLFTRYVQDPLAHTRFVADIFSMDLKDGRASRITRRARAHAPVQHEGGIWALRNRGQFNEWVNITSTGTVHAVTEASRTTFVQLAPRPGSSDVAVLARKGGRQGLYVSRGAQRDQLEPWLFFTDASIYDVTWSADANYLLFTADLNGVPNVFFLNVAADEVRQLTNVPFGAFEPALSPDGRTLAFVEARHEGMDIRLTPFIPGAAPLTEIAVRVPISHAPRLEAPVEAPHMGVTELQRYRTWRFLRPRTLIPLVRYDEFQRTEHDVSLGTGIGLGLQGSDPLQRTAYLLEGWYQAGRAWGEVGVETARLPVRIAAQVFDRSTTVMAIVEGEPRRTVRLGREEVGGRIDLRLPVVLHNNVRHSSLTVGIGAELAGERLFDTAGETVEVRVAPGEAPRRFRTRLAIIPSLTWSHGIRYNRKDLRPAAGLAVSSAGFSDAWTDGFQVRRAIITQVAWYRALVSRSHTALRLRFKSLWQNRGSIYDLDTFMPRGQEDVYLGPGTYAGADAEIVQPLWYVENGFLLLPVYVKAVYAYGFAEALAPVDSRERQWKNITAAGVGLGLQMRISHVVDVHLRAGASFTRDGVSLTMR